MRKLFIPSLALEGRRAAIKELYQEAGVVGKAFLLFWEKAHANCAESLARLA